MPGDWQVRFLGGPGVARCRAYPTIGTLWTAAPATSAPTRGGSALPMRVHDRPVLDARPGFGDEEDCASRFARPLDILRLVRSGELIDERETSRQRKDGIHVDVSITVSPIRGRDGTVIGA